MRFGPLLLVLLLLACGRGEEVATVFDQDQQELFGGDGLGTATPQASAFARPDYRASNNAELYRIDQGTFVVRAASADAAAFWCAAGEFAARRLGVGDAVRLWRIAPIPASGFAVQGRGVRRIIPGPGQIFRTPSGQQGFMTVNNALRQRLTVGDAQRQC